MVSHWYDRQYSLFRYLYVSSLDKSVLKDDYLCCERGGESTLGVYGFASTRLIDIRATIRLFG